SARIRYPRPPLLATMAAPGHYAVEASAGTGKTFLIERRIADLVLSGAAALDQILVVTYTEKATAELKRRVREFLLELSACREDRAAESEPHWVIDAAARARIEQALLSGDRSAIFTIHGFCHRVLLESAFAGGRLFEQTQVAEQAAFAEAFPDALRERFAV